MGEHDLLAARFEDSRPHLRAVAYRILGSETEAEDAVQEAWIRLGRTDTHAIDNLGGWLTTVVSRVCLDMLRSRTSRREEALDEGVAEPVASGEDAIGFEREALLADSVGLALMVVLENLAPAERVAFVLHDMFDLPFMDIATIVGRSPEATRQLASRARRRVQGAQTSAEADRARRREVVNAFLTASRDGDFEALLAVLDPDVVVRADAAAVAFGTAQEVRGAHEVATAYKGRAKAARPALIDGLPGMVWAPGGKPRVAFLFTITSEKVAAIELVADPERLSRMRIEF
jgi:RNA polymerase sigma-70 factor, ECF subfamily